MRDLHWFGRHFTGRFPRADLAEFRRGNPTVDPGKHNPALVLSLSGHCRQVAIEIPRKELVGAHGAQTLLRLLGADGDGMFEDLISFARLKRGNMDVQVYDAHFRTLPKNVGSILGPQFPPECIRAFCPSEDGWASQSPIPWGEMLTTNLSRFANTAELHLMRSFRPPQPAGC